MLDPQKLEAAAKEYATHISITCAKASNAKNIREDFIKGARYAEAELRGQIEELKRQRDVFRDARDKWMASYDKIREEIR